MSSTQTTYEDDPVPLSRDRSVRFRRPYTRRLTGTGADSARSARSAPKRVVTIDDFRGRPAGYVPRKPVSALGRPRQIINGILQNPNSRSIPHNSAQKTKGPSISVDSAQTPKSPSISGDSDQEPNSPSIPDDPAPAPSNRRGWMSSWASVALSLPPAGSPVGTYPRPVIRRRIRCSDEPSAEPAVPVAQADPALEGISANPSLSQDTEPPWQAESMQVLLDALSSLGPRPTSEASTADQQSDDGGSQVYRRKDDGRRADRPKRNVERKKGRAAQQNRRGREFGPGATKARPIEIEDDSDSDEALSTTSSRTLDGDVPLPAGNALLVNFLHTSSRLGVVNVRELEDLELGRSRVR